MPLPTSHAPGDTITAADINAIAAAVNALSNYTDEQVRDVIAAALVAGTNMTVTPNDGADTITLAAAGGSASFVGARVYSSASQSFSGGWTSIVFGNETYDTNTFHDNVTNNTRLTVPSGKAGKYQITAAISYATDATGSRFISVLKNGTDRSDINASNAISGFRSRVLTVATLDLAVGDYVTIDGYQNSGSSLEVGDTTSAGAAGETWASITYLGA